MKIMAITDLRGNTDVLESFNAKVREEAPGMIMFTGDIVPEGARFREWSAARRDDRPADSKLPQIRQEEHDDIRCYDAFFRALSATGVRAYVIPGGMDAPLDLFLQAAANREIVAHNIHVVHNRIASKFISPQARDMYVCGFGGIIDEEETETCFILQFSHWQALYAAESFADYPDPKVLLVHTPPKVMSEHGSRVVEEMINTVRPSHAFCGAVDGMQSERNIGTTFVVCPGRMCDGNYAIVDSLTKNVQFRKLEVGAAQAL